MLGWLLKHTCDLPRGLQKPNFLDSCGHNRVGIVSNNVADTSGNAKHTDELLSLSSCSLQLTLRWMKLHSHTTLSASQWASSLLTTPAMASGRACLAAISPFSCSLASKLSCYSAWWQREGSSPQPYLSYCLNPTRSLWSLKLCLQGTWQLADSPSPEDSDASFT